MPLFLLIETSTTVCSVALSRGAEILALKEINNGYAHAEHLTIFCEDVLREAGVSFAQLDAVGVSKGPGSYTGLRIGMSAAKGFCFGLNIPLIAVGTLNAMAAGMRSETHPGELLCPMIDARRMEVYTALFDAEGSCLSEAEAKIMDETGFRDLLEKQVIVFGGDGMPKCRELLAASPQARFSTAPVPSAIHLAQIVQKRFTEKTWDDLAYCEPFYLKNFVAGKKKM
ncbi:MAG: family M22 non-peptidase [Bacteroidetes bacterium]|nr:MAG: family M22 non-peptidase [Bacteroidota bacterium]